MKKILLLLLISSAVFAQSAGTLVKNGDFSAKTGDWFTYSNDSGKCRLSFEQSKAVFDVAEAGNFFWSAALGQGNIPLEKGAVYRLSFTAKSSLPKRIVVSVANPEEPYNSYSGIHKVNLDTTEKQFLFDFTMLRQSCINASLQFQCGSGKAAVVTIDEVSLLKSGNAATLNIPGKFPEPFAASMKRGINLGNTLDAPHESDWGPALREEYFDVIKDSRVFDHTRIPCRWETHTTADAPYTIDPEFMRRVDWAVSHALARGFHVVLNMHHHNDFQDNPKKESEKFLSMWRQISGHFSAYPDNLSFEIYNEPGSHKTSKAGTLEDPAIWNALWPQAYRVIHETNKTRNIIITGPMWGSPDNLSKLVIPADIAKDPNIMASIHFYYPSDFCFQGTAGNGADPKAFVRWKGSSADKKAIGDRLDRVMVWAEKNNIRIWNGEYGCFDVRALPDERMNWVRHVSSECEKRGIGWAYWDFSGDVSSLYNVTEKKWEDTAFLNMLAGGGD